MIRLPAVLAFLLAATGAALGGDAGAPASPQPSEVASCKDALPQIAPVLKATQAYAQALATLGPDSGAAIPPMLTGARRAALANAYKSFNAIRPDLEELEGNLEVLSVVVDACADSKAAH
jgi:hypothetical protein